MPRAAAMPTRSPVKLPGPVVTPIRSSAANGMSAWRMTRAISGINASAWPRSIGSDSAAILPCSVSITAAAQASSAVSMARMRMNGILSPSWPGLSRPSTPYFLAKTWMPATSAGMTWLGQRIVKSDRADFDHLGHIVLQQVLNAVPQRRRGRRAAGAGALHVQIDDAFLEALEGDVTAVIGDRRPHPCLDQVLDRGHDLGVGGLEEFVVGGSAGLSFVEQRRARHEVFHDGAEDRRLELRPLAFGLADRDEVGA